MLSLCQSTVAAGSAIRMSPTESIVSLIAAAKSIDYEAVSFSIHYPPGLDGDSRQGPYDLDVHQITTHLADTGLFVACAMSHWMTPDVNPDDFKSSLDTAAELGARTIQAVCNDSDQNRQLENFSRTCELAAVRGLKVALEFMGYSAIPTLADARRFIRRSGMANAVLCLDSLPFFRAGSSIAELATVAADEIGIVQLCDAPTIGPAKTHLRAEARKSRRYPGEGALPLREFVNALPKGCIIDIQAPDISDAHLTFEQRAHKAAAATQRFLASTHYLQSR